MIRHAADIRAHRYRRFRNPAPCHAVAGRPTAYSGKSVPRRSTLDTPQWTDSLLLQSRSSLLRRLLQMENVRGRSRDCARRTSEVASLEEWTRPPVTPWLEAPHALLRSAQTWRRLPIGCPRPVVRETAQYAWLLLLLHGDHTAYLLAAQAQALFKCEPLA